MNHIVVFGKHTARVHWNPANIDAYTNDPNVLINPSMTDVEHVPMQYWKREGDRVVPMDQNEMELRDEQLRGDSSPRCHLQPSARYLWPYLTNEQWIVVFVLLVIAEYFIFR